MNAVLKIALREPIIRGVSSPVASIIVPLHCGQEQALACLEGIAAQADGPPHEVLIVHDGSPALANLLAAVAGEVTVFALSPWPGETQAALLAAGRASTPTILTVTDHTVHAAGWLAGAVASAPPAPGSPAELTVVLPTLDVCSDRVRASVAALRRATPAPHVIVAVDNGHPAQGFSGPVNAGIRGAETPYIVVMNDDVEVLPGWWPPLRAALDAGAPVAFPRTVSGGMRHDFAAWCFAMTADTVARHGHAAGRFFDPDLVVWYQDTDLLFRLRAAGQPPVEVPAAHVRHGLSQTVHAPDPALRGWITTQVQADRAAFLAKHPDAVLHGHDLATA